MRQSIGIAGIDHQYDQIAGIRRRVSPSGNRFGIGPVLAVKINRYGL